MKNLKIGSHVSMSGKEMMLGSVKEAASYNSDTFMIYTELLKILEENR